ncbi:Snf7-domain-containing protein [Jimgerdemannia flammicorona]|uniref:Snf7-domain-containing protein n=1 Tax=Jimgerdemannia flammicorona TaxID=994334 RepID=A0A433D620_9FUNG|nr:Snf7-domain-containing protein [Jimgerdemannia flammicorona]
MFKFFSRKPAAAKITSQDKAILDLKVQRDKLKQYNKKVNSLSDLSERIRVVCDKEVEIAKKHLAAGDKKKALLALKKKKYQETLLERTNAQLINLEEMTNSIEFALVEKQVFDGLKAGNNVLKEIQNEMSLEAVEKLMDETADAIAYQNVGWIWGCPEISELLSGKITAEDEEDVLQELEQLQQLEIAEQLPVVPETKLPGVQERDVVKPVTVADLPEVPMSEPAGELSRISC